MAGMTLAQAEAGLAAAQTALLAAMQKKSYSVADRSKESQSVRELQDNVDWWEKKVAEKSRGKPFAARRGVPIP